MRPRPSDEPVIRIRAIETPFGRVLLPAEVIHDPDDASKEREKAMWVPFALTCILQTVMLAVPGQEP